MATPTQVAHTIRLRMRCATCFYVPFPKKCQPYCRLTFFGVMAVLHYLCDNKQPAISVGFTIAYS